MNNILKGEVRSINNLIDAGTSNKLIKYFQEENERAREHEKELIKNAFGHVQVYGKNKFPKHEYTLAKHLSVIPTKCCWQW